jgi:hypothetical protein
MAPAVPAHLSTRTFFPSPRCRFCPSHNIPRRHRLRGERKSQWFALGHSEIPLGRTFFCEVGGLTVLNIELPTDIDILLLLVEDEK